MSEFVTGVTAPITSYDMPDSPQSPFLLWILCYAGIIFLIIVAVKIYRKNSIACYAYLEANKNWIIVGGIILFAGIVILTNQNTFSISPQNNTQSQNITPTQSNVSSNVQPSDQFFNILDSGKFRFKVDIVGGNTIEIFADGNRVAAHYNAFGLNVREIAPNDGFLYTILDSDRIYTKDPLNTGDISNFSSLTNGMSFSSSGITTFQGTSATYYVYRNNQNTSLWFYLDEDKLIGISYHGDSEIQYFINIELDKNIPHGVFNLPVGYTLR